MSSRLRRDASPRANFFSFLDIITSVTGILILVTLILSTDLGGLAPQTTGPAPASGDDTLSRILRAQSEVEVQNALLRRLIAAASAAGPLSELEAQVAASKRELASLESSVSAAAARSASIIIGQKQQDASLGIDDLRAQLSARRAAMADLDRTNELIRVASAGVDERIASASNRLARARALHGQSWLRPDDGSGKSPQVILVSIAGAELKPLDPRSPGRSWKAGSAVGQFEDFCRALDPSRAYVVFLVRPSGIALFEELRAVAHERGVAIGYDAITEEQVIHVGQPPLDGPGASPPVPPGDGSGPGASSPSPGSGTSGVPGATGSAATGTVAAGAAASTTPSATAAGTSSNSQPSGATATAGGPPPPPKTKSWWERLVEFVRGLFA